MKGAVLTCVSHCILNFKKEKKKSEWTGEEPRKKKGMGGDGGVTRRQQDFGWAWMDQMPAGGGKKGSMAQGGSVRQAWRL